MLESPRAIMIELKRYKWMGEGSGRNGDMGGREEGEKESWEQTRAL